MMFLTIIREGEAITVKDDYGNKMKYYGYTREEAVCRFKETFGYRYKHGIQIVELSY